MAMTTHTLSVNRPSILESLRMAKDVARNPWAWPGGYPKYLLMSDGGALCPKCCRKEFRLICEAVITGQTHSGWEPQAADINWEDSQMYCDHCSAQIQSAYGDDEDSAGQS